MITKKLIVFILMSITVACCWGRNLAPEFPSEAPFYSNSDIFVRSGRTAAYGIPMIAVSNKGTVFAVVNDRLDSHLDSDHEQKVVLRRSFDNAKTWLPIETIAEKPDSFCYPTGLVCDEVTNKVFLFFKIVPISKEGGKRPAGAATYVIETSDEGKTWSPKRDITEQLRLKNGYLTGGQSGGNGLQLKKGKHKGRLVVSNRSIKGKGDIVKFGNNVNCVFYSDDHGKTWQGGGITRGWVGESCIVELSDGALYISNRNHDPNTLGVRSHDISYDGGETFTDYGIDPELIEPICHAGITRYDDKTVLFCNPRTGTKYDKTGRRFQGYRLNMTVRASFDDCKTWPVEKLIDPGWAGYSAIAVCKDGTILCLYEHGTIHPTVAIGGGSRQNVAIARFNMAWLLQVDKPAEVIAPPKK